MEFLCKLHLRFDSLRFASLASAVISMAAGKNILHFISNQDPWGADFVKKSSSEYGKSKGKLSRANISAPLTINSASLSISISPPSTKLEDGVADRAHNLD